MNASARGMAPDAPPNGADTPTDDPPLVGSTPSPPAQRVRELSAADVMSTPAMTVAVGATLWEAWSLLYRSGRRHLVVIDGEHCVGVLDDRVIAFEWPLGPSFDLARRVGHVVRGRARTVLASTSVTEIARIMLRDHFDALPVVTSTGKLVGLVTASDLLAVLATSPISDRAVQARRYL